MRRHRIDEGVLNDPIDRGLRVGPTEARQDGNRATDIAQRTGPNEGDTIDRGVWGLIHVM